MVSIEDRKPGYSLAVKLQETQNNMNSVSAFGKFFGISPLTSESHSWYTGMVGELRVGSQLDTLRNEGWVVLHSVPIGEKGSDIDHVAVSPTGKIFTINTKRHPGKKVKYYSKKIYINGQPSDHLRNSVYEMKRVAKIASAQGVPEPLVQAVIVFVDTSEVTSSDRAGKRPEVVITTETKILDALRKIEQEHVTETYDMTILHDYSFWTSTEEENVNQDEVFIWFNTLKRNVSRSASIKAVWGFAVLITASIVVLNLTVL